LKYALVLATFWKGMLLHQPAHSHRQHATRERAKKARKKRLKLCSMQKN
jgi:hypothetical protein